MGCLCSTPTASLQIFLPRELNEYDLLSPFSLNPKLNSLKKEIDDPVVTIETIELSPLAFCLVSGNMPNFMYLLETMNASIISMESLLLKQGLNGVDLLIEKGYLDLLQFYLPKYRTLFPNRFFAIEESETSASFPNTQCQRRSPIHIATERGFLPVIQYVYQTFKGLYTPDKYNIHYIDEYSGENAALIACKRGHLEIVKFLNEECGADFNLKSKRSENAVLLAAFGSKSNSTKALEVVKYLIEVAKVDASFQYEEILLILDDKRILEYIGKVLLMNGIMCSKEEVEKKYSIDRFEKREFETTLGAISSIDVNITNVSVLSIFQDSDSADEKGTE